MKTLNGRHLLIFWGMTLFAFVIVVAVLKGQAKPALEFLWLLLIGGCSAMGAYWYGNTKGR